MDMGEVALRPIGDPCSFAKKILPRATMEGGAIVFPNTRATDVPRESEEGESQSSVDREDGKLSWVLARPDMDRFDLVPFWRTAGIVVVLPTAVRCQ